MARLPNGHLEPMLGPNDGFSMMVLYDAGFIAVFAVFILLYLHAWRNRDVLELNGDERFETIERIGGHICMASVGVLSLAIVLIGGNEYAGWAGISYFAIGPLLTIYYSVMGRKKRKRAESIAALTQAANGVGAPSA